ncbi:hypothetical protein [Streptomyces sp. NPDC021020]|uniref:hypothetical protein n=1 Tax=Streptomyces sp. NPDC021020 TaxID=3365109 RepID=UPI0037888E46
MRVSGAYGRGAAAAAAAVALAATASGCGGGGSGPVVDGTAPPVPYAGPLHIATREATGDDPAALLAASGAAGRALECTSRIYAGGSSGAWSEGDGGSTPEEGLTAYFDMEEPDVPRTGYRVERRDADRVLFSYDVGLRTKVAVVVAKDQPGRPGWGPETSASCDPAELPASFTDRGPYQIWTDGHGARVPVTTLNTTEGPAHCGWQQARFLELGAATGSREYARDPHGVLPPGSLAAPYDPDAALPADARDTGYHRKGEELWTTPDTSRVYVRTSHGVEAWPAVTPGHGCA